MPFLYLKPAGYLPVAHSLWLILLFSIYAFLLQLNYFSVLIISSSSLANIDVHYKTLTSLIFSIIILFLSLIS